jgi:hypothetical protein
MPEVAAVGMAAVNTVGGSVVAAGAAAAAGAQPAAVAGSVAPEQQHEGPAAAGVDNSWEEPSTNNVLMQQQQQQQESEHLDAVAHVAVLPTKAAAQTKGLGSASLLTPLTVDEVAGQFGSLQVSAESPKAQRITVDAVPTAAVIDAVAAEALVSAELFDSVAGPALTVTTAAAAAVVVVGPVHAGRHQAGSGFGRILVRRKFLKNTQKSLAQCRR